MPLKGTMGSNPIFSAIFVMDRKVVMKKQFKFVYSFAKDEIPDAVHLKANNITSAKIEWENLKRKNDILLAVFCGDEEVWRNKEIENGYRLDVI